MYLTISKLMVHTSQLCYTLTKNTELMPIYFVILELLCFWFYLIVSGKIMILVFISETFINSCGAWIDYLSKGLKTLIELNC